MYFALKTLKTSSADGSKVHPQASFALFSVQAF
jgi:hypothetical protein